MNWLKASKEFLMSVGCEQITLDEGYTERVATVRAVNKGRKMVIRVQLEKDWGTPRETVNGARWDAGRYPFASVKFYLPTPEEPQVNYTHYMLVAGDGQRVVLTTADVVKSVNAVWTKLNDEFVNAAVVPNWTQRVLFFANGSDGWDRDQDNVWKEPEKTPMDFEDFVKSL